MNSLAPSPTENPLVRLARAGRRARQASASLEVDAPRLCSALRRAVPFLSRRGIPVTQRYVHAVAVDALLAELPRPHHVTPLATPAGRGALVLDAGACAFFLDGVLGGGANQPLPVLAPQGLTAPQAALVGRVADQVLRAFAEVLCPRVTMRVTPRPPTTAVAVPRDDAAPVVAVLEFTTGEHTGAAALVLPRDALVGDDVDPETVRAAPAPDGRVAGTLGGVDLELVVELARAPMRLSELSRLRVGDTLPLSVSLGDAVVVSADGQPLLRGHPTTMGGRIAIRIE
jgi:flagellar motor switch protein FliM